jgi:hypothetical protein
VLEFGSDDPFAARVITGLYHAAPASQDAPTHSYRLERDPDGGYCGRAPSRPLFGPGDLAEAWSYLEWAATEDAMRQESDTAVLHAAGVELPAGPALLVGESGTGKSTLAALMLERGHRLWGDDLVRFAPSRGIFSAFPRSLKLDNKSLSWLNLIPKVAAAATTGTLLAPECSYVSPAAIRRSWQAAPGRARFVVLLEGPGHRGPAHVERVSEAAAALLVSRRLIGELASAGQRESLTVQVLDALSETAAFRAGGDDPRAVARALERELS